MPPLTRWMIKTSLVYLVLALAAGLLVSLRGPLGLGWVSVGFTPAYFHLFMVGWISLLIFGVVFWMFPKYSQARPRGNEALGWAVYGLINAGLILRVLGESFGPGGVWGMVLVLSAVLQWLGGAAFVWNTWNRVKEK
jgi:hypothetical protein